MNAVLDAPPSQLDAASSTPPPVRKSIAPRPYRWTLKDFLELGGLACFQDRKLFLIDGEILEVPMANPPHTTSLGLAQDCIRRVFPSTFHVRNQSALPLNLDTDPEPDLAVVAGSIRDYGRVHPTAAQVPLVVEVSDSTLAFDLRVKSHLYAAAGIAEYWVIDVNASQLHAFREPVADEAAPRGFRYASVRVLDPADRIAPLAAPDSPIAVGDLMP